MWIMSTLLMEDMAVYNLDNSSWQPPQINTQKLSFLCPFVFTLSNLAHDI